MISGSYLLDRTAMNLLVAKYVSLASVPAMFILSSVFRVAGWALVCTVSRSVQPYVLMWRAHNKETHIQFAAQISTNITCILAGLIVVCFTPLAEPFINWWLGRPCFPGMTALMLVVGAFLIDALFIASVNFLIVLNHHRQLALFLLAKSILMIALGSSFATYCADPTVGITTGIFVATLISNIGMPFLFRSTITVSNRTYFSRFLVRPIGFFALVVLIATCTAEIPSLGIRVAISFAAMAATALLAWSAVLSSRERQACIQLCYRFRHGE